MPVNQNRRREFIKYWLPVITYAVLIFGVSSIPGKNIPLLFAFQDAVFHIVEYAIFTFLIDRALKGYNPSMPQSRRFWWTFSLSFVYAISDEFHQLFVPNRFFSLSDLCYDGMGIFAANIFCR